MTEEIEHTELHGKSSVTVGFYAGYGHTNLHLIFLTFYFKIKYKLIIKNKLSFNFKVITILDGALRIVQHVITFQVR